MAILNVGTLRGTSQELANFMESRKFNIQRVQEARWKDETAREIGNDNVKQRIIVEVVRMKVDVKRAITSMVSPYSGEA